MAYCTTDEVDYILANPLTSATNPTTQTRRNLLVIGRVRDKNVVSDDVVRQYIQWAGEEIDSQLSQMYKMPVCPKVHFQTKLLSDLTEYNSYLVLEKACSLAKGDNIWIVSADGNEKEEHTIDEAVGNSVFSTLEPIEFPFAAGSRVLHVKFPDPIPWIAVRLTVSNLYDKYFAAQASPNVSDYGKHLRDQARIKLSEILNGKIILHGVERTGRVLYDPNIVAQYGLPDGPEPKRDIEKSD